MELAEFSNNLALKYEHKYVIPSENLHQCYWQLLVPIVSCQFQVGHTTARPEMEGNIIITNALIQYQLKSWTVN